MANVQAHGLGGDAHNLNFDRKPDVCPICHHAVDPKQLTAATVTGNPDVPGTILEISFQCTKRGCARVFLARYSRHTSQSGKRIGNFTLDSVAPTTITQPLIPHEVGQVSPAFVKIYTQAAAAESLDLDEIAGVGYRKALEFLIKDYCVGMNSGTRDQILKETLGSCIANHVTDANVKVCAERAAWLGNDETHYVRKWEDKDIRDLKTLIELTINWIRSSILTTQYMAMRTG